MSRIKLPAFLEEMPNGPHKKDAIRHYVKQFKRKRKEKK